jgi:hypothetical protein
LILIEKGLEPPEVFYTQPIISEFGAFYWDAFHDLSSERQFGMGLGPIPRSAIMSYADECELGVDASHQFYRIIREIDAEFLRSLNERGRDKNIEEIPITDVAGTKQVLSRLAARASAISRKKHIGGNNS